MNPEFPHLTREELEVRLTALLLGELPPAEAQAIRQLAASDASVGQMLARLEKAILLVREGLAAPGEAAPAPQPPLQLAPEKRAQLLAQFRQPPVAPGVSREVPKEAKVTPEQMGVKRIEKKHFSLRQLTGLVIVATVLVLLAGLLLPSLGPSRYYFSARVEDLPGTADMAIPDLDPSARRVQISGQVGAIPPPTPLPEPKPLSDLVAPAVAATPPPAAQPEAERLRMKIELPSATEDEAVKMAAGAVVNYAWGGFGGGGGGQGGAGYGYGGRVGGAAKDSGGVSADKSTVTEGWDSTPTARFLFAPPTEAVASQPAPAAKPAETSLGFAVQNSAGQAPGEKIPPVATVVGLINADLAGKEVVKLGELQPTTPPPAPADPKPLAEIALTGAANVAGVKRAMVTPATQPPSSPDVKLGLVAAGDQVEFGVPAKGLTWEFENRGKLAAGKPAELAAKSELSDRLESQGRGATAAPQDPATQLPIAADHFYADTDGLALDGTRPLSRGETTTISGRAGTKPTVTTESLGRRPARPAVNADFGSLGAGGEAARRQSEQLTAADAQVKLAEGRSFPAFSGVPAAVPATPAALAPAASASAGQSAGGIRLPMPTLKGSAEDLPTGKAIENLGETVAQAQANWDVLGKSVAEAAPAAPAQGMAPEMNERFRRRYGISAPGGAPAPAAKEDSKKSVTTLGDTPMLGALFKKQAAEPPSERFSQDRLSRLDAVASGVQNYYRLTTNSVAPGLNRNGRFDNGIVVNNAWFDSDADGSAKQLYDQSSQPRHAGGVAIVLPGLEGQVVNGQAGLGTIAPRNLGEALTLSDDNFAVAPANGPVAAGRPMSDRSRAEGLEKQLALSREAKAAAPAANDEATRKKLEEEVRFRNILSLKMLSEKTDVNLPKSSVVEIVDQAMPATKPNATLWERAKQAVTGAPDQYQSTARIRAEVDGSDIDAVGGKHSAAGDYNPYFIQTESEVLQSKAVLDKVAEKLKLNEKWGEKYGKGQQLKPEETVALLKQKIEVKPERNTSLLGINVRSDDPDEAAQIANAVASEYQRYRLDQRTKMSVQGIKTLEDQFAEQDKKIPGLQKELASLQPTTPPVETAAAPPPPPKPPANAPIPQPEVASAENAFSTFSLNVADVSFKLAQASLEKGQMPDAAAIRSEEFINAFDYRDPEAAPGQPVAFAWERARFPFAHNRDALRFSVKTAAAGRAGNRPLNLVLLLDNSGSMERADRVLIIQEALRVLASQLQPQDKVSVVTFARTPRLWLDAVAGDKAAEALVPIGTLTPQGGTDLGAALTLAYQTALRHYLPTGLNRVVLLTDGAANLGDVDPDSLKRTVEQHRKQGVALDCFGIGWEGYNDDLLEVLTRNGDGRYGFVNTPEAATTEFAAQLAGALQVAASDVKVQVEFNPARVTNWRQVGYAKHQLTKEQFRDNTVDAAEIAAQEAGNGLYVIEVNPNGQGNLATVRVRYKVPGTTDYRELEWPVPYTGTAVPLEQASPAMRLLVASAEFSEWLARSPFSAEVSPDRLLRLVGGVPEVYGADERPKKLEWMIRQAKSLSGK